MKDNIVQQDLESIVEGIGSDIYQLSGRTLLLTGGSGFLGSHFVALTQYLNQTRFKKPCSVISIDNFALGRKTKNLITEITDPNIEFVDHNACLPYKTDKQVDYIIHALGFASPQFYKQHPIETIDGTIFGIKNALELTREKKPRSLLFFSSSEIYGDADHNFVPTKETYKGNVSSIGPRSCYDESKRLGEALCMAYHSQHQVPVKIVRPFNVYGPGMDVKDGRVIPRFVSQVIKDEPLTVYDKGSQTRTFCYITDAITGFYKVLLSNENGEVFNVGNDNDEVNMKVLADSIVESLGRGKVSIVPYPTNYPQDEPSRRCPDLTKIKTRLGYEPRVDVKEGVKRTYEWLKDHMTI